MKNTAKRVELYKIVKNSIKNTCNVYEKHIIIPRPTGMWSVNSLRETQQD